jgi:carboxypeptidase C (cathepsin A)
MKGLLTLGCALAGVQLASARIRDFKDAQIARYERSIHAEPIKPFAERAESYKYYNNKTKGKIIWSDMNLHQLTFHTAYAVESMPNVNYDIGEMYAGNIPIYNNGSDRSLFFVFYPKLGEMVEEITIWLNGGPGCSSMDGFLQENGPFTWQPGTLAPVRNQYSWVNATNVSLSGPSMRALYPDLPR